MPSAEKARRRENAADAFCPMPRSRCFWNGIVTPPHVRRTGLGLRLAFLTGLSRVGDCRHLARRAARHREPRQCGVADPGHAHQEQARPPGAARAARPRASCSSSWRRSRPPSNSCSRPARAVAPARSRGNTLTQAMSYFARRITGDDDAAKTWRADPPSPHDLRRTMETRLSALGVAERGSRPRSEPRAGRRWEQALQPSPIRRRETRSPHAL